MEHGASYFKTQIKVRRASKETKEHNLLMIALLTSGQIGEGQDMSFSGSNAGTKSIHDYRPISSLQFFIGRTIPSRLIFESDQHDWNFLPYANYGFDNQIAYDPTKNSPTNATQTTM